MRNVNIFKKNNSKESNFNPVGKTNPLKRIK